MQVQFAAHADDSVAMEAVHLLRQKGIPVQVLMSGGTTTPTAIALFSTPSNIHFPSRFLRVAAHRLRKEDIAVPAWAMVTPFRVALNPRAPIAKYPRDFWEALQQVIQGYDDWHPSQRVDAPWHVMWQHTKPASFNTWRAQAAEVVPLVSGDEWMAPHLIPIFKADNAPRRVLIISSCCVFNYWHTDVVDSLEPTKAAAIVGALAPLIEDGQFDEVKVMLPGGDTLRHPVLRAHLHPFIYESMDVAERVLGTSIPDSMRLWGRRHKRSADEIAEALEASRAAVDRDVVDPLRARVSIPISSVTWAGLLGDYIDEAHAHARKHAAFVRHMYESWIITGLAASTLHKFDPQRGFERAMANATMYLAQAKHLQDNPDHMVANCEQGEVYWRALEPVIATEVWGTFRPLIGMIDPRARPPWGY